MLRYLTHRLLIMIPTLLAISLIVFVIIQLPPGDYLTSYINELQSQGEAVDEAKIAFLREQYGLDKPWWQQYLVWLFGMLQGDFGFSFEHNQPVSEVVGDRLWLSFWYRSQQSCSLGPYRFRSASIPRRTSTRGVTTAFRFSAFSVWRRRTSCWRWCCCILPTAGLAPRWAA